MIAGGVLGMVFLCCGGLVVIGVLANSTPDAVLTAEFYPHSVGLRQHTTGAVYISGTGSLNFRKEYNHYVSDDGVKLIKEEKVRHYTVPGYVDMPLGGARVFHLREQDGFVEISEEIGPTQETIWHPIIKIGARAGDEWEREMSPGVTERYKLIGLEKKEMPKGLVQGDRAYVAQIEVETTFSGGMDSAVFVEEIEFGHGLGPVSRKNFEVRNGERVKMWSEFLTPVLDE